MEAKREYRMLAAQIRLLMELPELIWKLLEAHNYCNAAQVQQLGFHLYVGLSVESGSYGSGINVQKWFPVVKRQKVALTSFNDIIIKESEDQLRVVQLDFEVKNWTVKLLLLTTYCFFY
jgi:conserved oligomeric Golgi complex subunit 1